MYSLEVHFYLDNNDVDNEIRSFVTEAIPSFVHNYITSQEREERDAARKIAKPNITYS